MLFLPYELDVIPQKSPIANIGIGLLCILIYVLIVFTPILDQTFSYLVLDGWALSGLFGHMFLHADLFHLIGNMIYLWVFGNAICSRVGGLGYVALFVGLGLFSAIVHNLFDGSPALGASGAIYGIIGFYLAIYPTNRISCFWWIIVKAGTVEIPSYLLIGFWVLKDFIGFLGSETNVAHLAHLAGFFGGIFLGYWLVSSGRIVAYEYSLKTLPEIFKKT